MGRHVRDLVGGLQLAGRTESGVVNNGVIHAKTGSFGPGRAASIYAYDFPIADSCVDNAPRQNATAAMPSECLMIEAGYRNCLDCSSRVALGSPVSKHVPEEKITSTCTLPTSGDVMQSVRCLHILPPGRRGTLVQVALTCQKQLFGKTNISKIQLFHF
jgi:hypothetical protein